MSAPSPRQIIEGNAAVSFNGTPYVILTLNDYTRVISSSYSANKSFLVIPMERYNVGDRFIITGDEKEKKGIYILTNSQKNVFEIRVTLKRPDGSLYDCKGVDHLMSFRIYRDDCRDR